VAKKKPAKPAPSKWSFRIIAAGIFLAEIVVLRGAASPFRTPKDAIVLSAISLAIALAVAAASRRGSITLPRGHIVWALLALPILQAISILWSASRLRALESAVFTLIWVLGTLWLATLDRYSRHRLALVAAAGVTVSMAAMFLQIAGVPVFNLGSGFASGRLSLTGLTGNPADLAIAAVLVLPFLLIGRDGRSPSRLQYTLAVVLVLGVLLTRTLSGLGALGILFFVWLIQQRSKALWTRAAVAGAVLLAIALAAGLGPRLARGYERIQEGDWYALLSAREDGWSAAFSMIHARPLTGVGSANYDHLFYPSRIAWLERHGGVGGRGEFASHFNWAHSDPLQMMAELGIPGVVWMLFLLAALVRSRKRAGPLFGLAAAALTPFALLHYPTHLAVGLIPIALILGEIIHTSEAIETIQWKKARTAITVVVVAVAVASAGWQLRRAATDLWIGSLETALAVSQQAPPEIRDRQASAVETLIESRVERMPRQAPTLWRNIGKARFLRQDYYGAEKAFRESYDGWPHEDTEFYLGLSLASQGRRSESLQHLGRVCRTNPILIQLIRDKNLQRSVADMLTVYRGQ
jgi:O-antigen ligase